MSDLKKGYKYQNMGYKYIYPIALLITTHEPPSKGLKGPPREQQETRTAAWGLGFRVEEQRIRQQYSCNSGAAATTNTEQPQQ